MDEKRTGQIAVIFTNRRTGDDEAGYRDAAREMDALVATQPGYCGMDSVRGADGAGVTVSYWADEASAMAWRDRPEHAAIREQGRAIWYKSYAVSVARIERDYKWRR